MYVRHNRRIFPWLGGWVAANFSDSFTPEGRATHGLMSWALATLIVVGVTASAANTIAGNLIGPIGTAYAQYQRLTDPPRVGTAAPARPTQAQLEAARRNLALVMLASFFALIVGAGAAVAGSQWIPDERVRDAREPYPPAAGR